jgi:membrane-anchored glycerophosphoryl diester phosphodiesterase (GDPDase)
MKKVILMWLMSQQNGVDKSMKKKIIIGLGVFGIFVFVGLGIVTYLGVKTASFLIAKIPPQEQVVSMTQALSEKGTSLIGKVAPINCWLTFQSYLNLNIWLTKPLSENTDSLIKACLSAPSPEQKTINPKIIEEINDQSYI